MNAIESTVITFGESISVSSFVPGTIPPGHGASALVDVQLPLPVATMSVARLIEANGKNAITVKIAKTCFVFIGWNFVGALWLKLLMT